MSGVTNPSLMASDNTLLLFGVNFLSTDDISRYLGCPIQSAYYLDDSHCRITFANFEEAYYAL